MVKNIKNTKRKTLRLYGFLTVQPCIDDSIIVTTLSPSSLHKLFSPKQSVYRRPPVRKKKKDFLRGGCGCTQVKSREMGLGLILKNESAARRRLHYMQISVRPQSSKPQQILNCLPYIEQKYESINLLKVIFLKYFVALLFTCLLYTSPSPRDRQKSRMPSSA